ncbi:MAG TPA: hypothetical protein VF269_00865 [Rhodanobacteraceae bacterium]
MKKQTLFGAMVFGATLLAGCATLTPIQTSQAIRSQTAKVLKLASPQEVTISRRTSKQVDAFGSHDYTYTATTKSGDVYHCTIEIIVGLVEEAPNVKTPVCTPAASKSANAQ